MSDPIPPQPPATTSAPTAAMAVDPSQGTSDPQPQAAGLMGPQNPTAASMQPPQQHFQPQSAVYPTQGSYFNPAMQPNYAHSNAGGFGYPYATPFGAHPRNHKISPLRRIWRMALNSPRRIRLIPLCPRACPRSCRSTT